MILFFKGGSDATTTIMTTDNDIFHFKNLNGVLDNCKGIDVRQRCLVGNVSMNEKLSWLKTDHLVGRYSWVRTSNPQILRCLNVFEFVEECGFLFEDFFSPNSVIVHDSIEIIHLNIIAPDNGDLMDRNSGMQSFTFFPLWGEWLLQFLIWTWILSELIFFIGRRFISISDQIITIKVFWSSLHYRLTQWNIYKKSKMFGYLNSDELKFISEKIFGFLSWVDF